MKYFRKDVRGAVMAEFALAAPVFLFMIFSLIEFGRAMYVLNTLSVAAQQAASAIGIEARRTNTYNVGSFASHTRNIRFPGSVVNQNQFSFDVTNAQGGSTVVNGQADGATSTKVVVTVTFPPPGDRARRIPIFDPGNLIGRPVFGIGGLMLTGQATSFIERSRRPTLN